MNLKGFQHALKPESHLEWCLHFKGLNIGNREVEFMGI